MRWKDTTSWWSKPEALVAEALHRSLGDHELGQLGDAPGRKRQVVVGGTGGDEGGEAVGGLPGTALSLLHLRKTHHRD